MRRFGSRGVPRADPGSSVDNAAENRNDQQTEEVEVTQIVDVKRVQKTLPRNPVLHHRNDFIGPAEVYQHVDHEYRHQRKGSIWQAILVTGISVERHCKGA